MSACASMSLRAIWTFPLGAPGLGVLKLVRRGRIGERREVVPRGQRQVHSESTGIAQRIQHGLRQCTHSSVGLQNDRADSPGPPASPS